MATREKIKVFPLTISGDTVTLYGAETKIEAHIGTVTPAAAVPATVRTELVDSHTRKAYPGDAGVSVAGHARVKSTQKMKAGTTTTPGVPFYFETDTVGGDGKTITTVYRGTYTGQFSALLAYCKANAVKAFRLRRESGVSIDIAVPSP